MKIEFARQLMKVLEESSYSELEFNEADSRVRLVKTASGTPNALAAPSAPEPLLDAGPRIPPRTAAPAPTAHHEVRAGVAGMFFTRPSPGEPPFVSVGDVVKEGDKLGIIEAMKMLNPLESEFSGRIVEIKVSEGESVNVGDVIVVIEEAKTTDV